MLGDCARQLSLVERKKRQWAQERAELESLCSPWGLPPPAYSFAHQQTRSRYGSTLDIRETCPPTAQQNLLPRRQRSPSLPPILNYQVEDSSDAGRHREDAMKYHKHQGNGIKYRNEEGEGETSGYASDTVPQPQMRECWTGNSDSVKCGKMDNMFVNYVNELPPPQPRLPANIKVTPAWQQTTRHQEERRERWLKGVEEQRPRWGDRGVAAGRLWEPQDADSRLPQVHSKGTPTWVERSLNMIDNGDSQILIIDQQSTHSSGGDTEYKNLSDQQDKNTYLLGQNVPIEPNIKAEREYRRMKALELQAAIVQQLEDRERQKREEKEKRIQEEREEEERFRKQQELERQRLEEERRIVEEKQRREQKRAEALRQALERAEQQAKIEKENKKNRKLRENFDAMSLLNSESDYRYDRHRSESRISKNENVDHSTESKLMPNAYMESTYSPRRNATKEAPQSSRLYNNNCQNENASNVSDRTMETPRSNPTDSLSAIIHQPLSVMPEASPLSLVQIPISQEMFAPINFQANQGIQMAFLVPQNISNVYPCIHQPLFAVDASHQQQNKVKHSIDTDDSSTKLLTPSKYRNPNYKDASTQTDSETVSLKNIGIEEKLAYNEELENFNSTERANSEEKSSASTTKKEKRLNSEERALNNKDLESRPKWGVNKPPTQYKKQSEKDIFYTQKRKLRQRKRIQDKNYTSHSSDDRSPSPSKKNAEKTTTTTRNSLSDYHWRKKAMKPEKPVYSVETTQILPLECDQSGIVHVGEKLLYSNQKKVFSNIEKKPPPPRGITLSQKFMNDKYGNPKLWQDMQSTEQPKTKFEDLDFIKESRKKYADIGKDHYFGRTQEEPVKQQPVILDQLRSLRDSLKKQQQIWGRYENNRRSPSPKNELDLEIE